MRTKYYGLGYGSTTVGWNSDEIHAIQQWVQSFNAKHRSPHEAPCRPGARVGEKRGKANAIEKTLGQRTGSEKETTKDTRYNPVLPQKPLHSKSDLCHPERRGDDIGKGCDHSVPVAMDVVQANQSHCGTKEDTELVPATSDAVSHSCITTPSDRSTAHAPRVCPPASLRGPASPTCSRRPAPRGALDLGSLYSCLGSGPATRCERIAA